MAIEPIYIKSLELIDSRKEVAPQHYCAAIKFSDGKTLDLPHHLHPEDVLQLMKGTKHKRITHPDKEMVVKRLLPYESCLKIGVEEFFKNFFAEYVDFNVTPKINPVCSNEYIPSCLKELVRISEKINALEIPVKNLIESGRRLNAVVNEVKIMTLLRVQKPEIIAQIVIQEQKLLDPFFDDKNKTRDTCCLLYSQLKKMRKFVDVEKPLAKLEGIFEELDKMDEQWGKYFDPCIFTPSSSTVIA